MLMLRNGYTINDFKRAQSVGFDVETALGSRHFNAVGLTDNQRLFGASDDALMRFSLLYSFGRIVYENNKELTIPTDEGNLKLRISRGAFIEPGSSSAGGGFDYGLDRLKNNNDNEPFPFNTKKRRESVVLTLDNEIKHVAIMSGQHGIMFNPSNEYAYGNMAIFIRDDTGDGIYANMKFKIGGSIPPTDFGPYFNVIGGESPTAWTEGYMFEDYMKNISGEVVEEGEIEPGEDDGILDITKRFSPRVKTSALGAYPLNVDQVSTFMQDMWSTSFDEKILHSINGKPMDSVVSLRWYYGLKDSIPRTELNTYLAIGNAVFDGGFGSESSIVTKPASTEFTGYDFGTIRVPRHFNNFLDFAPFTEIDIFLPYFGFHRLNPVDVVGYNLRVIYNINIVTGVSNIHLYTRKYSTDEWEMLDTLQAIIGVDIPLDVNARESITSRVVSTISGVAGLGIGAASTAIAPAAGAPVMMGIAQKTTSDVLGEIGGLANGLQAPDYYSGSTSGGGGMNDESGSLGLLNCHLVISRPIPVAPNDYNIMIGRPDFKSLYVKDLSGYFKVGAINNSNVNIPAEAMREVEQLLKAGVYYE